MFILELMNGETFKATSVEENYRKDMNYAAGEYYARTLNIQVSSPKNEEEKTLEWFIQNITPENIATIELLDEKNEPISTLTGYTEITTMTKRYYQDTTLFNFVLTKI